MGNHEGMNQLSLMTGFERGTKRTAKQQFLEEMLAVVPWSHRARRTRLPGSQAGPRARS